MVLEKEKVCEKCQVSFSCFSLGCWCANLPTIFPLRTGSDCLCPVCLKQETQTKIEEYINPLNAERRATIKALGEPSEMVEGIDFYYNEAGYFVFTAWYHLRRGDCCQNNCKHCPYKKNTKK